MRCVIPLIYNDPFMQKPEPGWYDNQVVYYLDLGPVILDLAKNKVADIYQFIYGFDKKETPIRVMGQWNVIDVVPTIRTCGFEVMPSETIVNCPVL
ncbi:hypothetical protein SAMN05446037_1003222 [Anaerovirgula multivorans]|uniref:Uncharacterized protein n=1 Tax=Anaerovirgula multivorans TaxID=312168 RepID=A0A239BGE9_9FIRM|nr:hypothetical protein [Anaerovirgula multivorans]SNS06438.1 hypothetical protein SAMN05446037_1003222 [Anaerovirgula multivorans]